MFSEIISIISIIIIIIWIRVDYKKMKIDKELIETYKDLKEKTIEVNSNLKVYIEDKQLNAISIERLAEEVSKILNKEISTQQ